MGMSQENNNSPRRTILSEINVTPLVDVMLVLLIIFMVTAPMMQQGIDVDLPQTKSTGIKANEEPFVIYIKKNKKIYFSEASEPISLGSLTTKLSAIMKERKDKNIYIKADKRVEYGLVAQIMAAIQASGTYSIGLVTLPKAG